MISSVQVVFGNLIYDYGGRTGGAVTVLKYRALCRRMGRARFSRLTDCRAARAGRTNELLSARGQFRWFGLRTEERERRTRKKATKTSLECERRTLPSPSLERRGGFFWTTNRIAEHFSTPLSIAINYQSTDYSDIAKEKQELTHLCAQVCQSYRDGDLAFV